MYSISWRGEGVRGCTEAVTRSRKRGYNGCGEPDKRDVMISASGLSLSLHYVPVGVTYLPEWAVEEIRVLARQHLLGAVGHRPKEYSRRALKSLVGQPEHFS
jgi:hypothetical protein